MKHSIFDSHSHLSCTESILTQVKTPVGPVSKILNICTSIEEYESSEQHNKDIVLTSLSSVPQDALDKTKTRNIKEFIDNILSKNIDALDAIGETGLDFPFKSKEDKLKQIEDLQDYANLAIKYKKPLIIHCRDAFDMLIPILDKYSFSLKIPGIMHCFTGSLENAKDLITRGWKISISGIITFKKSEELRNVVKNIPLESIVVETDAPFLSPVPLRGKKNHPSHIYLTIEKISEIKNISINETLEALFKNTIEIFNQP
ncbi:MAG: YchF/TatD family DNA exonuclease [Chlamydiia bacterium]|nr:YchF/TatD family DNA exonuclease [Chlamydiia bacterium]